MARAKATATSFVSPKVSNNIFNVSNVSNDGDGEGDGEGHGEGDGDVVRFAESL
jgi:hypothetical protein